MSSIVCVGWITIDFIGYVPTVPGSGEYALATELEAACGGRAASQAMASAALDGDAALVARVGVDPHADMLTSELSDLGVATGAVLQAPAPTGIRLMSQPDGADPAVVTFAGANEYLTADDVNRNAALIRGAKVVSVTAEAPGSVALRSLQLAKEGGGTGILVHTPGMEISDRLIAEADVVVAGAATANGLLDPGLAQERSEHAARALLQRGAKTVLLCVGQRVLVAAGSELRAVPVPGTIDDEDAIDALVGGLCVGIANGDDLALAVARGARAAMLLISDE